MRFVPADLAAGSLTPALPPLTTALAAAGFDASEPAVVAWLGVTMYLTPEAVAGRLPHSFGRTDRRFSWAFWRCAAPGVTSGSPGCRAGAAPAP